MASSVSLLSSTGYARADEVLRTLISKLSESIPGRVRGWYVLGSYADGTAVELSDIDVHIVFEDGSFGPEVEEALRGLREYGLLHSPIALDLRTLTLNSLSAGEICLNATSMLVYGRDDRDAICTPPITTMKRRITDWCLAGLLRARAETPTVSHPLDYPDPDGEFHGYVTWRRPIVSRPPEWSTRDVVATMCRIATALLILRLDILATSKSESVALYALHLGGEWAELLTKLYERCKLRWSYQIPDSPEDRQLLKALCHRCLALENYYLAHYRSYLLSELHHSSPDHAEFALNRLQKVVYLDNDVEAAILTLVRDPESLNVNEAKKVLHKISSARAGKQ